MTRAFSVIDAGSYVAVATERTRTLQRPARTPLTNPLFVMVQILVVRDFNRNGAPLSDEEFTTEVLPTRSGEANAAVTSGSNPRMVMSICPDTARFSAVAGWPYVRMQTPRESAVRVSPEGSQSPTV